MMIKCVRFPCRIEPHSLRIVFALVCVIGIAALALLRPSAPFKKTLRFKYVKNVDNRSFVACRLPVLDPYHESVLKFVEDLGELRCKGRSFSSFENNVLRVEGEGIVSAQYRKIGRKAGDDYHVLLSKPVSIVNLADKSGGKTQTSKGLFSRLWNFLTGSGDKFSGFAKVDHDFIQVDAVTSWGWTMRDVHMHVFPNKEVLERRKKPGGIPLNIALIMFDSTSAANFKRKMPKSLEYLTDDLNSLLMRGETIVGDGTTAQLAALLTGIAEKDQPEARKDMGKAASPVDIWRWIFKDFKQNGYVTMFSEDSPRFGSFNYRLKGFKDPPTDHFARPFWMAAADLGWEQFCINGRASHKVAFEYMLSYFRAYRNTPKFSFVSLAPLTHENINSLGYADDDFKILLQHLKEESFLNSTFLVVFGDHGPRFSALRQTIQGKLEERLPFLSITTPKWFPVQYPKLYNNLVHNSGVLTTPFDLYATLRHIITYPEYPSGITTGQSLFSRIDEGIRTCTIAGVEEHWCPCLNLEEISVNEPIIGQLAEFVVSHMNKLLSQNPKVAKLCQKLVLKDVKSAFRDMPSETLQFFKKSKRDEICDSCGLEYGGKSKNTLVLDTLYQLQLVTFPNDGFYEASVRMKKGSPSIVGEISRLDTYKDQIFCLQDLYPRVRKYCYC
ncbi:uncharacterized protein [Porites lutea]|uniref:uncharacterized protein isoform X4 n=1 Tax=Porites lutea TaxID=51062 RepID=UPI003CC6B9A8